MSDDHSELLADDDDEQLTAQSSDRAIRRMLAQLPPVTEAAWLMSLTSPMLATTVCSQHLLAVSDELLFANLPFLLAALRHLAQNGASCVSSRALFVECVEILRVRVLNNRAIKLRFLLLMLCDSFQEYWTTVKVFSADAYLQARLQFLGALLNHAEKEDELERQRAEGEPPRSLCHVSTMSIEQLLANSLKLERWAKHTLFAPGGLRMRDRTWCAVLRGSSCGLG